MTNTQEPRLVSARVPNLVLRTGHRWLTSSLALAISPMDQKPAAQVAFCMGKVPHEIGSTLPIGWADYDKRPLWNGFFLLCLLQV
jgi:hypothetical protein